MREMHKWKDKVELSLDNRQIFFLFFGLSIVGCFVFALGVMVGRRVNLDPSGEVAALAGDSLSLLDESGSGEDDLTFKNGLAEPATDEIPPTRDPAAPPTPEGETPDAPALPAAAAVPAPPAAPAEPDAKPGDKTKPKPKPDAVLAASNKGAEKPNPTQRVFTLQMKAFAKKEDAESFAAPLRERGHDVRVESHEIKGRIWHRVRVGSFTSWADGLEAKEEFEKAEKTIIAYVVRQ